MSDTSILSTSPPYSQPVPEFVNNYSNQPPSHNYANQQPYIQSPPVPDYSNQFATNYPNQFVPQNNYGNPPGTAPVNYYPQMSPNNYQLVPSMTHTPPRIDNDQIQPTVVEESSVFFNSAPIADPDKIPNAFRIQWNFVTGKLNGAESFGGHPTYQFELFYIDEIFKDVRQKWNQNYHNAVKIFGPALSAYAIRATISVQYHALYKRKTSAKFDEGYVRSADAFLDKLNYGKTKKGKIRFYTYVIYKNSWRFCQTGAQFVQDMVSKHAVHANRGTAVVYAGEFFIYPEGERHIVIIDNNSGTYSPDKALLPKVVLLLQKNFPGLEVIALDFASPELQSYKEKAKLLGTNTEL